MPVSYSSYSFDHTSRTDYLQCSICNPESWRDWRDAYDGLDTALDHRSSTSSYEPAMFLNGYGYTPTWEFHGACAPWYGMEIEIEGRSSNLLRCAAKYLDGIAICKEDSSVRGIEIVTHPMSYAWASEHFPWEEFFTSLREEYGATTRNDENGIHVHVSRDAFGFEPGNPDSPGRDSHLYRWMKFVYRNQPHVERIARRSSSHWAEFTSDHRRGQLAHVIKDKARAQRQPRVTHGILVYIGISHSQYVADIGVEPSLADSVSYAEWTSLSRTRRDEYGEWCGRYYPIIRTYSLYEYDAIRDAENYGYIRNSDPTMFNRYSAINTQNPDTLEVRVFASTTWPVRALSALELCAASVEYTRHLTSGDIIRNQGWTWQPFIDWATGNQYDALAYVNAHPRVQA